MVFLFLQIFSNWKKLKYGQLLWSSFALHKKVQFSRKFMKNYLLLSPRRKYQFWFDVFLQEHSFLNENQVQHFFTHFKENFHIFRKMLKNTKNHLKITFKISIYVFSYMFKMIKTNILMNKRIQHFTFVSKGTTCITRKHVSMKQTKSRVS